jgi:hypothetical protein
MEDGGGGRGGGRGSRRARTFEGREEERVDAHCRRGLTRAQAVGGYPGWVRRATARVSTGIYTRLSTTATKRLDGPP